jgi:hypothetical protein
MTININHSTDNITPSGNILTLGGTTVIDPTALKIRTVQRAVYAPAALKNLYTGTNTDALYYNPDFDRTVANLEAGNQLIVGVFGGRILLNNVGDAFAWYLKIDGTDVPCGVTFVEGTPVGLLASKTNLSGSSVTVQLGGFSRFDSRTPVLDLRTNVSNEGSGNGTLGGQLNWVFMEVKS